MKGRVQMFLICYRVSQQVLNGNRLALQRISILNICQKKNRQIERI